MKTSPQQNRYERRCRGVCILTVFSMLAALLLTGCIEQPQTDTPRPAETAAQTTTTSAETTAKPVTTEKTAASTAAETTTTAPAETYKMPFGDIADAELLITNSRIYPLVFTPSAKAQQTLAEALRTAEWRPVGLSGSMNCPGTLYVRNGEECFSLYANSENSIYFRDKDRVGEYLVGSQTVQALRDAFADSDGCALTYRGMDIYLEDEIWASEGWYPEPSGTAPCGDFSQAEVCFMDVGLMSSVYVCTDTAVQLLSDIFNAAEWEPLPDDTTNEIAKSGVFYTVYINNDGFRCSFTYRGGGLIVYRDESGWQKYRANGGVSGALFGLYSAVHYNRDRVIGTYYDSQNDRTVTQEFDNIWAGVTEAKAEKPEIFD
ncbi:MAG: hypothetical protein IKH27_11925 [Oscillospiraceae bacterium]|nr:hypothetical protein [Oscillospiraceae bacterium]